MSIAAPRQIGQYELRDLIGRGGMAEVYSAYQPALDRLVAIKLLSPHLVADTEFMARFRQEARASARLTHPNIIVVHDFGEEDGIPFLIMEYIEGSTLGDLLVTGLPLNQTADLLDQIGAGLDFAHSRQVIHRDIKPHNVLVRPDGRAVLVDFGLARLAAGEGRLTVAGGIVGTPEYMSPEQAAGRPSDHRADVYSMGVLLYEMLTAARPFNGDSPLAILVCHLRSKPPSVRELRADVPASVETVVQKALAKNPQDRFQSAGDLAHAFRRAMGPASQATTARVGSDSPLPGSQASSVTNPVPPVSRGPRSRSSGAGGQDSLDESGSEVQACPLCGEAIPPDASMCPGCTYLLPFERQVTPSLAPARPVERREQRINLLHHRIRWGVHGFEQARALIQGTVSAAQADGWRLVSSLTAPGTFAEGRSAAGPIIQSALVTFER